MERYKIDEVRSLSLRKHINEHAKEYDLKDVVPYTINGTVHYYTVIMERKGWYSRER